MKEYAKICKRCGEEFLTKHEDYYICIRCGDIIENGGI